jgi:hypothetical protein
VPVFGCRLLRLLLLSVLLVMSAPSFPQMRHLPRHADAADDRARQHGQGHGGKASAFVTEIDKMIHTCGEQAAELRKLPLDAVARSLPLRDNQRDALEQVRSSAMDAAQTLAAMCPGRIPAELSAKLDTLAEALKAVTDSLGGLRPAIEQFYGSLDDEQKGWLLVMSATGARPARPDRGNRKEAAAVHGGDWGAGSTSSICAQWGAILRTWPVRQIESEMQLSDLQHATLYELTAAIYRSAGDLAEACPAENRVTPLGRLDAKRDELLALREDIEAIQPSAAAFESALNEAQRKQFAEAVDLAAGAE